MPFLCLKIRDDHGWIHVSFPWKISLKGCIDHGVNISFRHGSGTYSQIHISVFIPDRAAQNVINNVEHRKREVVCDDAYWLIQTHARMI
jgi:hypothetical protein